MISVVVLGVKKDVTVGIEAVVVSLVVVFFLTVISAVAVVLVGAQVVAPGCLVGWLLGG